MNVYINTNIIKFQKMNTYIYVHEKKKFNLNISNVLMVPVRCNGWARGWIQQDRSMTCIDPFPCAVHRMLH